MLGFLLFEGTDLATCGFLEVVDLFDFLLHGKIRVKKFRGLRVDFFSSELLACLMLLGFDVGLRREVLKDEARPLRATVCFLVGVGFLVAVSVFSPRNDKRLQNVGFFVETVLGEVGSGFSTNLTFGLPFTRSRRLIASCEFSLGGSKPFRL